MTVCNIIQLLEKGFTLCLHLDVKPELLSELRKLRKKNFLLSVV